MQSQGVLRWHAQGIPTPPRHSWPSSSRLHPTRSSAQSNHQASTCETIKYSPLITSSHRSCSRVWATCLPLPPRHLLPIKYGAIVAHHTAVTPFRCQYLLPPGEDHIWFDYNGLPLKWHIPVGVLFDTLCCTADHPTSIRSRYLTHASTTTNHPPQPQRRRRLFVGVAQHASWRWVR